ncbi:hypothetical protein GCM10022243_19540 [Saccharothrix violaceirubra]|uniref:CRISPR system Cascade subunit CasB n=1 Tax=Saccharothrix violaceirubra TaxID=413306 RepID=A0A7W7T240_9PSEU|nr:type I-E CRISPR-associated protein Cse2/CasB [Saccharothrix violaceirubra]MBB4965139.1 CRISPR system Cascade subunit CasB [Saccharothrix violaceirubra]
MTTTAEEGKPPAETLRRRELTPVGIEVHERIQIWQRDYLANRSAAVAALARLRRGVGKRAGTVPDLLLYTESDKFAGEDAGNDPTTQENAAHIAFTLYALHQQSHRAKQMNRRGYGLGKSLRLLHPGEFGEPLPPIVRRFQALSTSASFDEVVHHLRGAVQLLRTNGIPLDYGLLADELTWWQHGGASAIPLRWGREFYRTPKMAPDSAQS